MKRTISFKTLGCRLNQCETDSLASQFSGNGYEIVDFSKKSDVVVINTCTVTQQSDHKSRNLISQAVRKEEKPVVVVAGCMVDNYRDQLNQWDHVTYWVDNEHKSKIFSIVEGHFSGETSDPMSFEKNRFDFGAAKDSFHTRSLIKIQDGCDNFCTFCIIPKVRGRAVSRPATDILENIRQVLDFGFKEIVLTGVNIGRYRHEDMDFDHLVEKVLDLPGDFRVRISSIEPEGFGDRFINLIHHPKMTPHLHLCLQSGSDEILYRMKRKYTVSSFYEIADKLRKQHPDFNLTTDIIVGFPGETDEDFQQSLEMVSNIGFSHVHTFKFSMRLGTYAGKIPGHVPEKIKTGRSLMLREIAEVNKRKYFSSMAGKHQTMLVERHNSKGWANGYGEHFIPLQVKGLQILKNTFVKVKLEAVVEGKEPVMGCSLV